MPSRSIKDLFEVLKPGSKDWILANSIDPTRLPAHIAIIMDGNGRWARRRNLPRVAGHKAGMDPVRNTVETCTRLGIQALTLYAFSAENWKRPRAEVDMLWRLLRLYLSRELPDLLRNGIRFSLHGPNGSASRAGAAGVGNRDRGHRAQHRHAAERRD